MQKALYTTNQGFGNLLWLSFCCFLLIFSLGISWQSHKSVDFFYGFWHKKLNIELTIKTFAAQNNHGKKDFAHTPIEQHLLSFSQIVTKIHNQGEGLNQLVYLNHHQQEKPLLTLSEVIHLQDVSDLVDQLRLTSVINLLLLLIVSSVIYKNKVSKPKRKDQYIAVIVPSVIIIASFSVFGFTDIFYYLHTVVFPDNHQWFFYYQESLMSTLMKAPDLFAAIGFTLSIVALLVYVICYRFLVPIIFKNKI
jgi:uncharacterized membrane protein